MVPIMVMVVILCVEAFLLASAFSVAQKAARDAARAASMGMDGAAAAAASLPSWARMQSVARYSCDGVCYRVELRVPLVVPGLTHDSFTLSRSAEMPEMPPTSTVGAPWD
jgi:hypothetical protein